MNHDNHSRFFTFFTLHLKKLVIEAVAEFISVTAFNGTSHRHCPL